MLDLSSMIGRGQKLDSGIFWKATLEEFIKSNITLLLVIF